MANKIEYQTIELNELPTSTRISSQPAYAEMIDKAINGNAKYTKLLVPKKDAKALFNPITVKVKHHNSKADRKITLFYHIVNKEFYIERVDNNKAFTEAEIKKYGIVKVEQPQPQSKQLKSKKA